MVDKERENGGGVASKVGEMNGFTSAGGGGSGGGGWGVESSSGVSLGDGFRTYKRRKHLNMGGSEPHLVDHGKVSVDSVSQQTYETINEVPNKGLENGSYDQVNLHEMVSLAFTNISDKQKRWRDQILEQMYQSLSDGEGGLRDCIRNFILNHPERSCRAAKNAGCFYGDRCPSRRMCMAKGSWFSAEGLADSVSSGSLIKSSHPTNTQLCQCAFVDMMLSEKFAQLCSFLFENFQGMKFHNFLDVSLIDSRMREGAYENSPMLFNSDIQQVWSKLEDVGAEMVAFAKSLSDRSRVSYFEQVGGAAKSSYEGGKDEHSGRDSNLEAKTEQTEACGVYQVCTCRHCGEDADGRNCLVCDSCEGMFHISCISPAVEGIPLKSWYCATCTAKGIGSPHEDCVVCQQLNAPCSPIDEIQVDVPCEETPMDLEESSNGFEEDGHNQMNDGDRTCYMCRNEVKSDDMSRICGHHVCPHKYYHVNCLTNKQLISHGPCWYCPSCLCRSCLTDQDDEKIVLCDGCDSAYHIYCMQPPRNRIPRGKWFCRTCELDIKRIQEAKMAYENMEHRHKQRVEEARGTLNTYRNELQPGGVDMLLNAAVTLDGEENLAATGIKA